MLTRLSILVLYVAYCSNPVCADEDVITDDFESYTSNADLQATWVSVTSGSNPLGNTVDPTTSTFLTTPSDAVYSNYDGQAAVFDGALNVGAWSVNEYRGATSQGATFNVAPSATQNVELTVDLGHDFITSNKRSTLGLRGPAGIIELGFYNDLPQGPNGEFFQFAYRNVLFGSGDTNWQPYTLDESIDQIFEVGESAFHRFKAVISETDVTFSLDLFADGVSNATADYDEDTDIDGNDFLLAQRQGTDTALFESQFGLTTPIVGVDAVDVVPAVVRSGGFDNLRFGIPSAFGSSADPFLAVDNVSLRLVDIPSLSAVSSVPEPSSAILVWLAIAQLSLAKRHRKQPH